MPDEIYPEMTDMEYTMIKVITNNVKFDKMVIIDSFDMEGNGLPVVNPDEGYGLPDCQEGTGLA